jgi:hypothetical protein
VLKKARVDTIYGLVNLMDMAVAAAPRLKRPALVLFGSREEVIPPKAARLALGLLPREPAGDDGRPLARMGIYREGYHMLLRDLAADAVRRDIVAWIEDAGRALPSGADEAAEIVLAQDDDEGLTLAAAAAEAERR